MNAIDRLNYYCNYLPEEKPATLESDPSEWPKNGRIVIKDLELRYPSRPNHSVVKNLNLDIRPGEKIGVVGRTGSGKLSFHHTFFFNPFNIYYVSKGKSTILNAIFRIIEPFSGSIEIDGLNILDLGLDIIRSKIQVITQEPILFTGSIRSNLDIKGAHPDSDLWEILGLIGLKDYVSSLPEKLESPVLENGENLSVGQRQLMVRNSLYFVV
jgi:ATP-binding cassette, subfamily C (CFTR/MRP), member 1